MHWCGVAGPRMPDIVAVILAGGEGRRIGGHKPMQRVNGLRLIDIALARVRTWGIEVAVSVRYTGQVPEVDVPEILDAPFEGPIAGLVAALHWAGSARAVSLLVVPCDTPALPPDLLTRLKAVSDATRAPCFARSRGGDHPACAVWPLSATTEVEAFATAGGRSLKGALERCGAHAVEWRDEGNDPFFNINTETDLQNFQIQMKRV